MKRFAAALLMVVSTFIGVLVLTPQAGAAPYCGIRWGSLPKEVSTGSAAELVNVRAGRHTCFDRLVLDFEGPIAGYFVRYTDQVVVDGSGELVPLRGGARLQVIATAPTTPTDAFFLPNGEIIDTTGYRTFRHVAWAGSFEGQSTIGLGVRARLPFRVFILDGPGSGSRLVLDVAHRW